MAISAGKASIAPAKPATQGSTASAGVGDVVELVNIQGSNQSRRAIALAVRRDGDAPGRAAA
jgi:hypothetical protein